MAGDASEPGDHSDPAFAIPAHPERRYPHGRGVTYEGGTVFSLRPADADVDLRGLVEAALEAGPYRYGDFLDLPMPVYLVRDDDTGDVFRVSVRDGQVRFHVLPETGSAGLRALYDRIAAHSESEWRVDHDQSG